MNDTDRCMVSKWNGAPCGAKPAGTARSTPTSNEYGVCEDHIAGVEAAGYTVTRIAAEEATR